MREAGVEPIDIPAENFHIVPPELYKRISDDDGMNAITFIMRQAIFFNARHFRDNPVNFGAVVFHELLHLKSFLAVEVNEEGDEINATTYRSGVSVRALQRYGYHGKYHHHFWGLNEAIVAEFVVFNPPIFF